MTEYPSSSTETTVANSPVQLAMVILPLGIVAGALLGFVADWVVSLPWVPMRGPFRLLQEVPSPFDIVVPAAVGLAGGVVLWLIALEERMVVRISDYRVEVSRKNFVRGLPRQSVAAVFLDGKQLVIQDRRGAERLRFRIDNDERKNLEKAFGAYGYPWIGDGDPYRDQFRRWVPGVPDLPAGADALLRAREKALERATASRSRSYTPNWRKSVSRYANRTPGSTGGRSRPSSRSVGASGCCGGRCGAGCRRAN